MRKALPTLLSAMAIVAMAPANMSAHAPQPVNPPAELPAGISVSPVQGFVDISNNASPNGVSSIGLSFSQEVVPNAANTEPALLYHNDMDNPRRQHPHHKYRHRDLAPRRRNLQRPHMECGRSI